MLRGIDIDAHTRCRHYRSARDVVAIALPCCEGYFACIECHEALTEHEAARWPRSAFEERAVLCGVCRTKLTIAEYLGGDHHCPRCGAAFNPGCQQHWDRYFAVS